ncbi:MAG: hypothetical protein N3A62_06000 [Thermodesulfovibrionales bacterium]|nr:hypothetical protein [Thermodesulfovibrionales bacterium]
MINTSTLKQKLVDVVSVCRKIYLQERLFSSLFVSSLVILVVLLFTYFTYNKDVTTLKTRINEYQNLSKQYEVLKVSVDSLEKRATLSKGEGVLKATQRVFDELGLSKKLKSAKVTNTKDLKIDYLEESIDIVAEGLTINEVVNILFRIEKMPMLVSIKSMSIKRSFENPENLNLQLSMAYYSKK